MAIIADHSVKSPMGILSDVLLNMVSFIFPFDFVIFYCKVDFKVSVILGRAFMATERVLVDIESNELMFGSNNKEFKFNEFQSMKQPTKINMVSMIDVFYDKEIEVFLEEKFAIEALVVVVIKIDGDESKIMMKK